MAERDLLDALSGFAFTAVMGITAVAIVSFCRGLLTRLARIAAALETLATQQEPRPR